MVDVTHMVSSMGCMELALINFSNYFLTNNSNRETMGYYFCLINFVIYLQV